MADDIEKPSLERIVEVFKRHDVEFLVLGGQAAVLHGSPLPTFDVDLAYRRASENLGRLVNALRELHPTLRGAPPDLPFKLDSQSLALGSNFTFNTDVGALDLLGWIEPLGTYDDLIARSECMEIEGVQVAVISLDDLIAIKRHINRPKDQMALLQLEAIKRLRDSDPKQP
jgi:hypothetical protein